MILSDDGVSTTWVRVCDLEEWERVNGALCADSPVGPLIVWGEGTPQVAFHAACPHRRAPLFADGICGREIICNRHGALFDIISGRVVSLGRLSQPPGRLTSVPVRVENGIVEIAIPAIAVPVEDAVIGLSR